jgi:hypothetical protein
VVESRDREQGGDEPRPYVSPPLLGTDGIKTFREGIQKRAIHYGMVSGLQ